MQEKNVGCFRTTLQDMLGKSHRRQCYNVSLFLLSMIEQKY